MPPTTDPMIELSQDEWAGGDRPHYLRLDVESLSGRRIA